MSNISKTIKLVIRKNKISNLAYKQLHRLKKNWVIRKVMTDLERLEKYTEKEIYDIQHDKLFSFLSYAYNNTDYYKRIIDENKLNIKNISDFKRLPFLSKEIIKQNSLSLVSEKYDLKLLAKKNTGGSTGKPLEFYCNTKAGLIDYAYHFYQYKKMGYLKGDMILGAGAVVIPEEIREKNIFWTKIGDKEAFGNYKLSILYLNEKNVKFYVEKLIELRPRILRGYPSLFDSLAQYILNKGIKLDFKIKGISLTSEMCSDRQRHNIEKAFSSMVYFEYGHTEVSVLCHSNDKSYKYISYPMYGYVEVLNEDGSETEIGEVGNIIVTGFLNEGMPFIRYRTEDLGRVAYKNGGVVHFSAINGRTQDFLISKDGSKVSIAALTSWQHLKAFANISKWQVIQDTAGKIEFSIIKGTAYSQVDETEIKEKIQNITDVDITFRYVDLIPRTKGGKHLFMIQKIKF